MNSKNERVKAIEKAIDSVYDNMRPDNLSEWMDDVNGLFNIFITREKVKEIIPTLMHIRREIEKKSYDDPKIKEENLTAVSRLINKSSIYESDILLTVLRNKGYGIANNDPDFRKALSGQMLKILELIRMGKREDVMQIIFRIFTAQRKAVPKELIEILKTEYDNNQFKAFIFAFISGFIGDETNYNTDKGDDNE